MLHNGATSFTFNETGILTGADCGIRPLGASVAANALTVTLAPCTIDFRSATLTNGTPVQRQVSSTLSLTVPSGATLGTINAVQSDLYVLAIDNAGTVELAIVNASGGNDLSETGVISTTAISAGSTSASTIYSTSARTNVAYRVVGLVRSTQATAGTWASAPSLVQGQGGNALAAMMSLGYGQTWQSFTTGNRASGTTYYNTTARPIIAMLYSRSTGGGGECSIVVNGITAARQNQATGAGSTNSAIVPPGSAYVYNYSTYTVDFISELR